MRGGLVFLSAVGFLFASSVRQGLADPVSTERMGRDFWPSKGCVLHISGQSREDLEDYAAEVSCHGKEFPLPAGVALYTNLGLVGLSAPFALSVGDRHQDLPALLKAFSGAALQVALYLSPSQLGEAAAGKHDEAIARFGKVLKRTGRPVYLRIGFEFDGPHNQLPPEAYVKAYRHIAEGIRKAGADNVSYIWHSYACLPTFEQHDPMAWWPGDRYVNWIGISFFIASSTRGRVPNRERLLAIARETKLPMMICEAAPVRHPGFPASAKGETVWKGWFDPFFAFIERNPEVRAFSIINCDWDVFSLSRHWGWGDSRLQADHVVLDRWRKKMRESRYLHAGDNLYKSIGFLE